MNIFLFPGQQKVIRSLVTVAACAGCLSSIAQQKGNPLQLADQYFAAGEYYTAAHLYDQFLHPRQKQNTASYFPLNVKGKRTATTSKGISRGDILFKQAESYRLAKYWQEAAAIYKECIEKYPTQTAGALYWSAVCARSLGQYATAEELLRQFSAVGLNSPYAEAAAKEMQTLAYIRQQLARPDSVLVTYMQKLYASNSHETGAFAPVHLGDEHFLISSTQADSVQVRGVNPYHSRLFYASLGKDSLERKTPVVFAADPEDNQGAAAISADGNYLYFSQWKKENGRTVSAIYYAVKQTGGWSAPVLLPLVNKDGYNSKQPSCSADGNYLFFASDRPGGSGSFDIWYAPLAKDGTVGEPANAGAILNTTGDEQAPFYHTATATLVFSSDGRPGMGGYDFFAAKGSGTTWQSPENLGYPVNSPRDDIYFLAQAKTALLSDAIFSSDRGDGCCLETYRITKSPKSNRLEGLLRDCGDNMPAPGADVILKDASGKIWKTQTDADGKYTFDLANGSYRELSLVLTKESYKDTAITLGIKSIDDSDLLTDILTGEDLCIEKKPVEIVEEKLVIKAENVITVYFDFDRSVLKKDAVSKLDSIYTMLVENPVATIQISGYTDGLGSDAYNKILSDKRAKACADYLFQKGIDAGRISFVSFGACCPVEMEIINGRDNPDGRSRNRRALINIKRE